MVWGCISASGIGNLVFLTENINAGVYTNILANNLFQSADKMGLDDFIFQHDGAKPHTARITENWLERKGIRILNWASQSPDLNPIEHIWSYMKNELSKKIINDINNLKIQLSKIWNEIPQELCEKLCLSMPRRSLAVYKSKGGHTKY